MPKTTPEDKDAEIGRLHMELKETQEELEAARSRLEENEGPILMRHSGYKRDPWGGGRLPVPRLQFHYEPVQGWSEFRVFYSLVYRHRLGHVMVVPLGVTTVGPGTDKSGPFNGSAWETKLYDPFREGVHIRSDRNHLKLPAFKVHEDTVEEVVDFKPGRPILPGDEPCGDPVWSPRFGPEVQERLAEKELERQRMEKEQMGEDTEE